MSCVVCCVHAGVRVLRACKCKFQCCMHVCVRACVHECMCTRQCCTPACVRVFVMCTCECCTPACMRVLHACICTCGVRLHGSRLTFSSLVIRFSSRWIRNQGPAVYHQTPPPEPPATTGRTAGPRCPRPARSPRNHFPPSVRRRTGHPSRPPRTELFL